MKFTNKKFNNSKCKKCIWRTKIDSNTYYCMFSRCIKEIKDKKDE